MARNKKNKNLLPRASIPTRPSLADQIAQRGQASITTTKTVQHFGPLPTPDDLAQYERAQPGSAERIIAMAERTHAMAEKEQSHRHELELKAIEAQISDQEEERTERKRGQYLGFAIGTIAILGGCATAAFGQPWAGGIIGAGGITSLVTAFIYGKTGATNKPSDDKKQQPQLPAAEQGKIGSPGLH